MPTGKYFRTEILRQAMSERTKKVMSDPLVRKKISEKLKGRGSWNKGKKASQCANKISKAGRLNGHWKGDEASYSAKHHWITNNYGKPTKCELCRKDNLSGREINWASISHKYKRDRKDWMRLCTKCHGIYDKICKLRKQNGF
jgi:stalled ribosome alternative rescue factor ArfA